MENNDNEKWDEKRSTSLMKNNELLIEQSQKNTTSEIKKDSMILLGSDIDKIKNEIPKTPGIYKILNKINNKFYTGSPKDLNYRLYEGHLFSLRANKHINRHLQFAWNLYEEKNFIFEIMEFVDKLENETELEFKKRLVNN